VIRLLLVLALVVLPPLQATRGRADDTGDGSAAARAAVERLHAALLEVMKLGDRLDHPQRYARLDPVIQQVYDLPFMSAKTLGRHWRTLSETDRERWLSSFTRLTVYTYADRFDEYSGQQFEVTGVEPASHETLMVRTQIILVDEDPIELDYRLRNAEGRWRIIDVFLNGTVSELNLRRSEYSSVFKRDGFEHLLASLEEKSASP